jgi:hypothetical protein
MKGDFTRSTFDRTKHFSGVRMQQGRVQLDADWNENLDILRHRIETEAIDVIGECGVPIHDAGFGVVTDFNTLSHEEQDWLNKQGWKIGPNKADFYLTRGRAYVDGILVENEHTVPFTSQPFGPGQDALKAEGIYQLYLDVWERHITALEEPSIREVALGGPDTATRTQVVWQAVLAKVGEQITCSDKLKPWPRPSTGKMRARTQPEVTPDNVCTIAPGASYRRLENQLYRVEIHRGSTDEEAVGLPHDLIPLGQLGPTFKWSRDNGSVVVAISEFVTNSKLRTAGLGRDDVLGLHENDWVEVLDDDTELAGKPGTLVQITKIDPGDILTLSKPVTGFEVDRHAKLRRWDSAGEILVTVPGDNEGYLKLEGEGIEIGFESATAVFHCGDYWLIPARTVPGRYGDIEWPQDGDEPAAQAPLGIVHHYCRLAVLTVQQGDNGLIITPEDCRMKFPPLTELPQGKNCCCSVTVGIGGDFHDLQEAIDARPQEAKWWTVCVMPGLLGVKNTVTSDGAKNLTIRGCGNQSRIYGPAGKPVFKFSKGQDIKVEGLYVKASSPEGAILFSHCFLTVINCTLFNKVFNTAKPLLVIDNSTLDDTRVEIRENVLDGFPAIRVKGAGIDIVNNQIQGGGIQIIPPSRLVTIEGNSIRNGEGAGIQLGGDEKSAPDYDYMWSSVLHMPLSFEEATGTTEFNPIENTPSPAAILKVKIHRNTISDMEGSGIITETTPKGAGLCDVEWLSISDNQIFQCRATPDVHLDNEFSVGGGIVAVGIFNAQITSNFIAHNGVEVKNAACGIFVHDGSAIDICDNVVAENGTSTDNESPAQYQAGITAHLVYGNLFGSNEGPRIGYPALRVCNNTVVCPAGQALSVVAMGGVVVDGNTLVTRGRMKDTASLFFPGVSEKGSCVFMCVLGLPVWASDFPAIMAMMASTASTVGLHMEDATKPSQYPDGRVMFHNNQVTFASEFKEPVETLGSDPAQWPMTLWKQLYLSALFVSTDDLSLNGNQFQASVPPYWLLGVKKFEENKNKELCWAYCLKFIDVGSIGTVVRANANGFSERMFSNVFSYSSIAAMNVTTSNEATHWIGTYGLPGKKKSTNNVSLMWYLPDIS